MRRNAASTVALHTPCVSQLAMCCEEIRRVARSSIRPTSWISGTLEHPTPWSTQRTTCPSMPPGHCSPAPPRSRARTSADLEPAAASMAQRGAAPPRAQFLAGERRRRPGDNAAHAGLRPSDSAPRRWWRQPPARVVTMASRMPSGASDPSSRSHGRRGHQMTDIAHQEQRTAGERELFRIADGFSGLPRQLPCKARGAHRHSAASVPAPAPLQAQPRRRCSPCRKRQRSNARPRRRFQRRPDLMRAET